MSTPARIPGAPWAIVIADDHGCDSGLTGECDGQAAPVQYCWPNGRHPVFQDAVRRAMRVAPISQVLVTAQGAYRHSWEPALWAILPEHRFVSTQSGVSWLTTASAILAIRTKRPIASSRSCRDAVL